MMSGSIIPDRTMVLVEKKTLSAITSTTFSNLSSTRDGMYFFVINLGNATANNADISVAINSDVTANHYYNEFIYCDGAAVNASRNNNNNLTFMAASSATLCDGVLVNDGLGYPRLVTKESNRLGVGVQMVFRAMVKTATVADITDVTFTSSVANSMNGSIHIFKCRP